MCRGDRAKVSMTIMSEQQNKNFNGYNLEISMLGAHFNEKAKLSSGKLLGFIFRFLFVVSFFLLTSTLTKTAGHVTTAVNDSRALEVPPYLDITDVVIMQHERCKTPEISMKLALNRQG